MAVVSLRASQNISKGNAVRVDANGAAFLADATTLSTAKVLGLSLDNTSTGNLVRVSTDDEVELDVSNLETGTSLYLQIGPNGTVGTFSDWNAGFASLNADAQLTRVGRALAPNKIVVEIEPPQLMTYS